MAERTDPYPQAHTRALSPLLAVKEVRHELNCSVRTVWRLIAAQELDVVRVQRAVRVTRASLDRFVERGGTP